jgi:hypothetical protein
MAHRRKRHCIKKGWKTEIQDYGPAKKRRVCRKWGKGSAAATSRKKHRTRKSHWCVFKGVRKTTCHLHKATARAAARRIQRKCKHKVTVRSVRRMRKHK